MNASSRQTLLANLIQQACAAALLLVLPNVLDKKAYAETVFVGVLMSFIGLADLGLSLVYGRLAPALLNREDAVAVKRWDTSVVGFGLITSSLFAVLIAVLYWLRSSHVAQALLLVFLPVATFWASFHVSRVTVKGDFSEYRRVISMRSIASLLAIAMSASLGLVGWFASQVVAALLVLFFIGRRLLEPLGQVDWVLVRRHIPEGLILCAITASWLQLLNFARLYASVSYPAEELAHYGVASAAYQSLSTLLISAFLPVSVGVLSRFGHDDVLALQYVEKVLVRSVWWTVGGAVLASETAPIAFGFVLPAYRFDGWMLFALLSSVVFYPFLILFGNCLIAKRRGRLYLALILANLALSILFAVLVDSLFHNQAGAACAQLMGLAVFTLCLLAALRSLFPGVESHFWRRMGARLTGVIVFILCYGGLRWVWART